ncbi:MAG: hypothetical protein RMJ53_04400 [Chitinophagales bacterium]|nr:hypothetical protein [Chitinophagales bacterium]
MTTILPIPTQIAKIQQIVQHSDIKLSEVVKMKTATLKGLAGCAGGGEKNKTLSATK